MGKTRHNISKQLPIFVGPGGRALPQLSGAALLFGSYEHRSHGPSSEGAAAAAAAAEAAAVAAAAADAAEGPCEQSALMAGGNDSQGKGCSPAAAVTSPTCQEHCEHAAGPTPAMHPCNDLVSQHTAQQGASPGGLETAAVAAAAATAAAAAEVGDVQEQVTSPVPCGPAPMDWLTCVMAELLRAKPLLQAPAGLLAFATDEAKQQLVVEVVQEALAAYCAKQPQAWTTSHVEQQLHMSLLSSQGLHAESLDRQPLPAPAPRLQLTQQDLVSLFGSLPPGRQQGSPPQVQVQPTREVMAACMELVHNQLLVSLAPAMCPVILPAGLLHAWEAQKELPDAEKVGWLRQQGNAAGLGGPSGPCRRWLTLERCCTGGQWMVMAADLQEEWVVQLMAHQEAPGVCRCTTELLGRGSQSVHPGSGRQGLGPGNLDWSPQMRALSELVSAMLQAHNLPPWQPQLAAVLCPQQLPAGCTPPAQLTALWALTALAALAGGWPPQVDPGQLARCGPAKWAASLAVWQQQPAEGAARTL